MKKQFALVAAAFVSLSVLGGCSPKQEKEPEASGEQIADAEETTETGNHLVVQLGPDVETIDPALNSAIDGSNMIIHLFEPLLTTDQNNQIVGGMAESWEVSEDGLTYTFHLRKGLKWSDGSDLTAEDFVYTFKRVADPKTASPNGYDLLSVIEGYEEAEAGNIDALAVSAPDPDTFVVKLSAPCIYFDKICAFAALSPVQRETVEANGEAWATDVSSYISNGPMKMKEWVPGSHILMEKNENYWNADAVTADTIRFVLMDDVNAAYSAYQNDELMMIREVPTEEIPALASDPEFMIEPILATYYITLNFEKECMQDARVRQALSLSLDREYIAATIMQGTYTAASRLVGPGITDAEPGSSFLENSLNQYDPLFQEGGFEADLDRAKELLAEAGYPGGEGFPVIEYMTNDGGYNKVLAEYVQNAWGELGIQTDIHIMEWAAFTATRKAGDFEVARNGWAYSYDDPSYMLNVFAGESNNNHGKYSSSEYDELLKKASATPDRAEHYQYLHEAEEILMNDMAVIPISWQNDYWMQKSELKGTWHSPYGYWYFMYGYID